MNAHPNQLAADEERVASCVIHDYAQFRALSSSGSTAVYLNPRLYIADGIPDAVPQLLCRYQCSEESRDRFETGLRKNLARALRRSREKSDRMTVEPTVALSGEEDIYKRLAGLSLTAKDLAMYYRKMGWEASRLEPVRFGAHTDEWTHDLDGPSETMASGYPVLREFYVRDEERPMCVLDDEAGRPLYTSVIEVSRSGNRRGHGARVQGPSMEWNTIEGLLRSSDGRTCLICEPQARLEAAIRAISTPSTTSTGVACAQHSGLEGSETNDLLSLPPQLFPSALSALTDGYGHSCARQLQLLREDADAIASVEGYSVKRTALPSLNLHHLIPADARRQLDSGLVFTDLDTVQSAYVSN
ncbi:uncharacterized protein MKK02DRAFT_29877 [Dioszegia hungarica]|uniref:Uncharacterized protein n=1 Tax=Dioszegia hungarica TaxID=4972 RepID=A0AA38HE00_9TREE|nr:uncharacterized protein MKK02DRAFT_29877 [Dioszegia hungarica]KAI9639908.1 hypothetical protein MKK02DRAFT_29877 [Dioszegia hungarica]